MSISAAIQRSKRCDDFQRHCSGSPARQGKAQLYHETITWAYLLLIRERIARAGSGQECRVQTWEEFGERNADLLVWKGGVLDALYRQETLDSDLARHTFVLPDRRTAGL